MKVFGTAGVRMRYPGELDPLLALKIGSVVGRLGLSKQAIVVHDTRTTGYVISCALASGFMSAGVDVVYVGTAPTPVAGYAALRYKSIGVSVTASHNPPEYNGMKFYDPEGYEFTRSLEIAIEKALDDPPQYADWSWVGKFNTNSHILEEYIRDLVDFIGKPSQANSVVIALDCANGSAYCVAPTVVRTMGAIPVTFNCNPDGFFPVRPPEPRRDVLESLLEKYRMFDPHAVFAFDGDADRLAVLDPVEGFIRQDRLLALFAKKILEEKRGHVVVSVDTGYVVDDVVLELGGTIERYPLGKTHERVKELGRSRVVMAGEPWKLIHTAWGPWVDGLVQAGLLAKYIVETGKPVAKLLKKENIPDYPWDRRSYVFSPVSIRDVVYGELAEELKSLLGEPARTLDIDGIRFEYNDYSWILVRKSGTEPKLRIYAEARTTDRLNEIVEKVERKITEILKKHGGKILEITIG